MLETSKSSWNNPPAWLQWIMVVLTLVLIILTLIIAIFAITGPKPELLNRVPGAIGMLLSFVLNHRFPVAAVLLALLCFWIRRAILRGLVLAKEWLYVRPLVFLIRPAVQRIIQPAATPSASEPLFYGGGRPTDKESPPDMAIEGSIPGWRIIGNWEIREEQIANWEPGPDWIRGKHKGTVLWREHLPTVYRVRFEACLLQNKGGDEIDVIVGDSMALYYSAGVRLDYMTNDVDPNDLKRDSNKKLVAWEKPQVGKWYVFTVIKRSEKASLIIDDKQVMDITWGPRTHFGGRLGFHHWDNEVEFKNLRIEKTP